MRVFYRSECARRVTVYRQGKVRFCCAEMCRRWGVLIGFGAKGCASTSRDVCLYLDRPQAHGPAVLELVPVTCCPWCGEPVEVCREK